MDIKTINMCLNRPDNDIVSFLTNYPSSLKRIDIHNNINEGVIRSTDIEIDTTQRRKQLNKKEKEKIIRRYYDKKQSIHSIAQHYGRNDKTISRIIKKHKDDNGNINRKTKLNETDKKIIINLVHANPSIPLTSIQQNLQSPVSICTINRYLRKNGYDSGNIRKQPCRKRRKKSNVTLYRQQLL